MRRRLSSDREHHRQAAMLKALAHPVRLKMLLGLRRHACNVGQMWRHLGISQPLASQHLLRLRRANLVVGERRGQETCYRLAGADVRRLLRILYG